MNFARLLPVVISLILLAAHFYRAGQYVLVLVSLVFVFLLLIRKTWVPRLTQLALLLGAFEWLRTLYFIVQTRVEFGLPWNRLAIILGVVALFTALSGLVFRNKALCKRYTARNPVI